MSTRLSIKTNELCELEEATPPYKSATRPVDALKLPQRYDLRTTPKTKVSTRDVAALEHATKCKAPPHRCTKPYNMSTRVLFVSTHSSPDDLIKMLVGDDAKPTLKHDRCNDYEWTVKNDVPVRLCALNLTSIYKLFYKFPDTVKSVVVYVNLDNENWLPALNKIRYFLVNICKPNLRVCCIKEWSQNVRNNERMKMWCVEYDFEMVNLNPDEEDLRDAWETATKVGVERLAQILYEWY